MATIKQIAQLAGVSRGTVDRVLHKRGAVNEATAKKVLDIAEALDYRPNIAGKTLAVRKKGLRFGFVLFGSPAGNPFIAELARGAENYAVELAEYGVAVETQFCPVDKPKEQARLIGELVAQGIDGLAVAPINHPAVRERVAALTDTGFPVVTVNSDIPGSGRLAYVGSNSVKSGETAAGLLGLVCGGGAKIGVVIGSPWILCHEERVRGFVDCIDRAHPGLQVVETAVNNDDDIESFSVTRAMLAAHPEIDALYIAAAGVEGACRAVHNVGRRVRVVSHDLSTSIEELVQNGTITATITQQPRTQGTRPLELLLYHVGMDIPPARDCYYTKNEIKIRENLHVYDG